MKKEEFTIRVATKDDIQAIAEIEKRSFSDPYSTLFLEILLSLNGPTSLVAEKDGRVIGCVIATKDRSTGHIVTIAVLPEEREKMVGRTLMTEIIRALRKLEVETLRLEVRRSNLEAQRFYEAQGFEYNHEIRGYYGEEDAFVYYKRI